MKPPDVVDAALADAELEAIPRRVQALGVLSYGDGAGCACKADWAFMDELRQLRIVRDAVEQQLGLDDAGVMRLDPQAAMAASIDFIGPVARDAGDFGYVAAAHALSDVFAVGAVPMCALVVAAWPRHPELRDALPAALDGMQRALADAGVSVLGGHTAYSEQPLLGLCAFGRLERRDIAKREVRAGDAIYLTKPLGTGVAIGALREGRSTPELERAALHVMRTLNSTGLDLVQHPSVKLVSDVTGYGLLGQSVRLAERSGLSVSLNGADLPALPLVRDLIRHGAGSAAAERNWGQLKDKVVWRHWTDVVLAADPQTNGPLLVVADDAIGDVEGWRGRLFRIGTMAADRTAVVSVS